MTDTFAFLIFTFAVILLLFGPARLADRINQAFKGDRGEVKRDMGGLLGGLGDIIGGDK